ncbi:MAG: bifunctional (p)ppGpp synthetase/guanosine-3',5'-bis(diphosphate) 3'-pyrophosphohydrolase [Bacteroidaceae bacterium]|nr:bifunctional (p)ppGpp synthetase/guanosine-3',5'-bis(diphosphate) 3'-pyrophosphohydrolase [Bacteroidaceae bacterium]
MDDEKMVSEAFEQLLQTYLNSPHRRKADLIERAYNFAKQAHKGVRRLSGEPYIMHPIAVAQIACGEIGLGSTSICAALLHDVVEDTDYTVEDISNLFSPKIAQIVDGVTKISGGIFGDQASLQAENFKKLLITMSDDIRVILVKLSDRLHNMRTLGSQRESKRYKIAGETLYLYAPLAHRLGLNKIKEELEDLSFHYEHPDIRKEIIDKLATTQAEREEVFNEFTAPLRAALDSMGMHYEIKARVKSPYSIYTKMVTKHVPFEEVYDILAVRIIYDPAKTEDEVPDCFRIYGKTTEIYQPHPQRFRNWLSHPKANGYQALHGTFMNHHGQWIEVQIRSRRMDDMAEQGFAAHWKYKEGAHLSTDNERETELEHWLSTIKEILDDPQPNAMDFLDTIKLGLYASEIFVVTPKGEFKTMPAECTVLDFAFTLHTVLGLHCIGAKVNHTLVPISHKLHSGDQVEILTSNKVTIQKEWLEWACTAKAKVKIESALRKQRREKAHAGEKVLQDFLKAADIEATSVNIDKLTELHNLKAREVLFAAIGEGEITLGADDLNALRGKAKKSWRRYIPFLRTDAKTGEVTIGNVMDVDKKKKFQLNDDMLSLVTLCDKCTPLPGDPVLGYVAKNGHISIHKRNCHEAARIKASDGNALIAVEWALNGHHHFPATIHIKGIDIAGTLAEICTHLRQLEVNIHSLRVECNDGIFELHTQLEVHSVQHLKQINESLRTIEGLQEVRRLS